MAQQPMYQNASQVMKAKEGQSNIFHQQAKDQFNAQSSPQKRLIDRVEIGAYNINWWNTNQYRDVPQQPQQLAPQPFKVIQAHNRELENIIHSSYCKPSPTTKNSNQPNEEIKRKNHLFSDIFESNLQKYYYEQVFLIS